MGTKTQKIQENLPQAWARRNYRWLLAGILIFSVAAKTYRLSEPEELYFDEVYHGYTAKMYLHGDSEAFNPWAKNPPGFAVEWTHPPLAKTAMAVMMGIFGENSFGWRFGSVIAGTAAIGLTAVLANLLFGSPLLALLAALLLSLEGSFFVQSRIAMNDSYFVAFALFAVIQYVRWKETTARRALILTGIGLGLAAATKWTTLYLIGILGLDLMRDLFWKGEWRRGLSLRDVAICWFGLPAVIYIGSYFQFFLMGNGWAKFTDLQHHMWSYHSGLAATHPYSSKPYQWLLNLRPIFMYTHNRTEFGQVANIYNVGNSVVLVGGLVAVLLLIFKEKTATWSRWFVLLCYFFFWLPWVVSPRVMFSYHYGPALPFLCIILALVVHKLLERNERMGKRVGLTLVSAAFVWFVCFFPHWTALPISKDFADSVYHLLPGWR